MFGSTEVPATAPANVTVLPIPVTLTFASAVFDSSPNETDNCRPVTPTVGLAKSPQLFAPQVNPPQPILISFVIETEASVKVNA